MRAYRTILFLVFIPTSISAAPPQFSALEDFLLKPAAAIASSVTKIFDANNVLWKKVNTEQVNIAIDDLRDSVNGIDRAKRKLREEIINDNIEGVKMDEVLLRAEVGKLDVKVKELQTTLDRFHDSINEAAGSSLIGDDLTNAADDMANGKLIILNTLPDVWKQSHSKAADQMAVAQADAREIMRALDCLQTTINTGVKPKDCEFSSASTSN